jgi:hypothetical protein
MDEKEPPRHDETSRRERTPVGNDIAPDGMDSESEGDELEASGSGAGSAGADDDDDGVEPDGARENPRTR